ncbi:MAG: hypothetical protein ACK5LM_01625 [Lactovum sp.]
MKDKQIEQLIQEIVNEVMKRIGEESSSESEIKLEKKLVEEQKITIALNPCREAFNDEYLEILDSYPQSTCWRECAEKSDVLILNWIDFNRITYLANLQSIDEDELSYHILSFLMQKKTVLILAWEHKLVDIKKTSRFGLWRKYDEILEKLESYGVEFIRSAKHLENCLEKENKRYFYKGGQK